MISVWGLGAWDMRHVWVRGIVASILSGLCTALGLGFSMCWIRGVQLRLGG